MPHPWALRSALIFTAYGTALGLYAFINPRSAARLYGVDIQPSLDTIATHEEQSAVPFVFAFAGRTLAVGAALFVFYWQQMPRAMGILLLCLTVGGAVDVGVTSSWGLEGKALVHGVGAVVMGLTGWGLLV
ncbi:hypothetical protein MMC13_000419 [Lambiella insularis]|nr:hypothetical protein [Lambiella insularis]